MIEVRDMLECGNSKRAALALASSALIFVTACATGNGGTLGGMDDNSGGGLGNGAAGSGVGGRGGGGKVPAPNEPLSAFIVVDQFGYLPDAEKIAVIRDPQTGY